MVKEELLHLPSGLSQSPLESHLQTWHPLFFEVSETLEFIMFIANHHHLSSHLKVLMLLVMN